MQGKITLGSQLRSLLEMWHVQISRTVEIQFYPRRNCYRIKFGGHVLPLSANYLTSRCYLEN